MNRRTAMSALAGGLLFAIAVVLPAGSPAADAPAVPTPETGTTPPAEAVPGNPVPSAAQGGHSVAPVEPSAPGRSRVGAAPGAPPVPSSVPSRLPVDPPASLVAPPSEKAPDRVLAPGEVDLQVNRNLGEDAGGEGTSPDDFFANASVEVEKGKEGMFAGIANPIDKFIRYFQTRGRSKFELYLSRSGKYTEMMRGILARYGLPEDLVYLALIESGFSPKAYSVAKAAGPWQFIAETGRRYGLRIDWWADERRDAEKSTHAAASYLKDLYGMFESWPLAAAAYNAGEGKIIKAVNRYKSDDYAELIRYRYLKQETKDYVPKMLAALAIAKEPEKYGFGDVRYESPLDLTTVEVPGGTDLAVAAEILEVPYDTLREWNPELRRFCTPPNRDRYGLRLSDDAARLAGERMEDIRTRAKVTFLQHNVRRGETLPALAEKYGASPAVLKELNGLKRDSLSRTSRLVIPVTGLSGDEAAPGKEISPDQLTMSHMRVEEGGRKRKGRRGSTARPDATVTVRPGDTLGRLARAHGVSAKELARANGLSPAADLAAGSRLIIPGGGAKVSAVAGTGTGGSPGGARKRTARYKVHKGDTLERIARVYGIPPARLAERNRMKPGDSLRQGTVLVIPLES